MWSGRFREPLDRTFEQWQRSFPFDWRLYERRSAPASRTPARSKPPASSLPTRLRLWSRASTRSAKLQRRWAHRIEVSSPTPDFQSATDQIGAAIVASSPQAEDIHHFIELELTKLIGSARPEAPHSPLAATNRSQPTCDFTSAIPLSSSLAGFVCGWRRSLDRGTTAGDASCRATRTSSAPNPYSWRTGSWPTLPCWRGTHDRLLDCRKRTAICPLGSGAVAGATLPLDRSIAANILFDGAITTNSMDATTDRDFMLELTQAAVHPRPAHLPLRRRDHPLRHGRVQLRRTPRSLLHRLLGDAAEEESRPHRARSRQIRSTDRLSHRVDDPRERPSTRLQQRSPGRPGANIRCLANCITGLCHVLPNFTRALKFRFSVMQKRR